MTESPLDPTGDESPPLAPGELDQGQRPEMAPPTMPPRPNTTRRKMSRFESSISAFLGLSFLCVLVFVCSGGNLGVIALVIGIFLFVLLHYVLWGWWLGKAIRRQVQQEQSDQR